MLWIVAAGIGLWLVIVLLQNVFAPSPFQVFRNYITKPIPKSVTILNVKEDRGEVLRQTFLSFTIHSNDFNRILQKEGFWQFTGMFFEHKRNFPQWFEPVRTRTNIYFRFGTNRWFGFGSKGKYVEALCRDETGTNAFYYYLRFN